MYTLLKSHNFHFGITTITPLTTLVILVASTWHTPLTSCAYLRLAKRPSASALMAGEAFEGPLEMLVEDSDALEVWAWLECWDAPEERGDFIEGDGHVHVNLQGY